MQFFLTFLKPRAASGVQSITSVSEQQHNNAFFQAYINECAPDLKRIADMLETFSFLVLFQPLISIWYQSFKISLFCDESKWTKIPFQSNWNGSHIKDLFTDNRNLHDNLQQIIILKLSFFIQFCTFTVNNPASLSAYFSKSADSDSTFDK